MKFVAAMLATAAYAATGNYNYNDKNGADWGNTWALCKDG